MDPLQAALVNLWQGNTPLWVAFWVYGHMVYGVILGAFISMYVLSFQALQSMRANAASDTVGMALKYLGLTVNVVDWTSVLLATGFIWIAIWRCAENSSFLWCWAARGYLLIFVAFVILGALRVMKVV